MATYVFQVGSGSATATTDLGMVAFGMRNASLAGINGGTDLVYGFYSVDASGRIFTQGPQVQGQTFVAGSTRGMPSFGWITGGDLTAGNAPSALSPFTLDTRGALRSVLSSGAASIGAISITGQSVTAWISGTATVSGNVSAFIASANLTGLSAVYVTASGQVSAIQSTSPWVVSANNLLTVSAGITGGTVAVTQSTSPWVVSANNVLTVSANNLLTVSAGVTGGSLGITGGSLSAVTAYLASSVQAFTSGSATAAAQQGFNWYGLVDSAGTSAVNNAIDAKYGWHTVNSSGHAYVKVTGTVLVSATNLLTVSANNVVTVSANNVVTVSANNLLTVSAGVTGGSLGITGGSLSAVTAMLTSGLQAFTSGSATAAANQGIVNWYVVDSAGTSGVNPTDGKYGWSTVDASGHNWSRVYGTALVSSTNLLSIASATLTGLSAVYVTASGQVSATIVSASIAQITANAGTCGGVFVSSTATTLAAANTSRKSILIVNNGSVNIWIGTANSVATAGANQGVLLSPSGSYGDAGWGLYTGTLWGVTTGASATAAVWERT